MAQNVSISININRNIKNWMINAVRFYYQRTLGNILIKRNSKLWVFSAWEGVKYSDNARSLFEYINSNNDKNIECIWMTKNRNVYESVIAKGYKACLIGTQESKRIQRKAGVAIRTHGMDDFGDFPDTMGAYNVHVCHGVGGNKRTYYGLRKSNKIKKILSITKAKLFNYAYRDMTIATSKFCEKTIRIETLSKKDMPIIGLSRNDIINVAVNDLSEVFTAKLIDEHELTLNNKFVTFMPTYRPLKDSQEKLEQTLRDLLINDELNEILRINNAKMIIKLHYATDISNMNSSDNIIIVKDTDVEDTQNLLRLSDLLITDYSSCAMDFSLKKKDVVFFSYDLEDYEKETGFYEEFMDYLKKYSLGSVDELIQRIKFNFENEFPLTEATVVLNELFNERSEDVGNFRKFTYEYICKKIEI